MSREAVERVVARMCLHHLKSTGRLPDAKVKRVMEKKAQEAGKRADNKIGRSQS